MKKNSLMVLSLVTVCSLITACNKSKKQERDETGKVIVNCWINEGNKFQDISKDSIWKQIEEKCGVNLQISGTTHNETYYTTLNPKVNTGEIPDLIFSVPSAQGNAYNNWVNQDLLWNYDELLAQRPSEYKYLRKIFESNNYRNIRYGDNMHTMLPYFNERSGWTIYYRADWLVNVGYYQTTTDPNSNEEVPLLDENGKKIARVPLTMDEFEDVMIKFTENDPDGNGKKDTCGLSPGSTMTWFNPLFHAFDVTTDYDIDENGEPTYQYLQPQFKNFLVWANSMYKRGCIDSQFASNVANTDDRNKFYNGHSGILITNGSSHVQWVVKGAENVYGRGVVVVGPAPIGTKNIGVEGKHGFSDWGGWWGGFSISKDCADPHAVMRFLDYINSPEGNALFHYGVKGKHYDLDEEGNVVPNIDERDGEPLDTFYSVPNAEGDREPIGLHQLGNHFQTIIEWNEDESEFHYVPDDSSIPEEYKEYFHETININKVRSSKLVNVTCWPSAYSKRMKKIEDYTNSFGINAISGKKNLTSDWDNMLNYIDQNTYEWSAVKKMIKEVARNCGII